MKLQEWKSMNNKPMANTAPVSGSYKKRFEKLIKYHIDHASSELESVTTKDIKPYGFHLGEHYNTGKEEFNRDIVASADKNTGILTFGVFVDGKEVCRRECQDYEEFVNELGDSYMYVTTLKGTPDYEDLLVEWVDSNGKKVSLSNSSNSTSSQPASLNNTLKAKSQVKRYSRLTQQIDTDGLCTNRRTNKFNNTTLDLTLNTAKTKDLNIRIVYDPADDDYELITNGKTSLSGCDYENDILPILIAGGIISNTNLCESTSFADDFKLYENLWEDTGWISLNSQNNTSTNSLSQTDRFKSLLAQINNDTPGNHYLRSLSDKIFYVTVECPFGSINVRVWFVSDRKGYTLQLAGDAVNEGTYSKLNWQEVLDYLIDESVIENTNLII